jgi:hypothetical protein
VRRKARRTGCLIVGLFWAALFAFTFAATTIGDCSDDPDQSGCEERRASLQHRLLLGELVLLVGIGWFFYRLEMKDGEL